ncbi:MAG: metal-sensing transcriptional repressor [Candidatus Pacebacteria bacterium]|nr:metal-sensing transcriptional repressor [Candidatus Paceibacterota bacterium]
MNSNSSSDNILKQLKRIRGQVDGVIKMYDNERACLDIVHQVIAARNSLGRVAKDLLTSEASRCSREQREQELSAILTELFKY